MSATASPGRDLPGRDLCTQDRGLNQTQSSAGQQPILGKQTFGEEKTEHSHQKSHDPLGRKRYKREISKLQTVFIKLTRLSP